MAGDDQNRIVANYKGNYDRLVDIKWKCGPGHVSERAFKTDCRLAPLPALPLPLQRLRIDSAVRYPTPGEHQRRSRA